MVRVAFGCYPPVPVRGGSRPGQAGIRAGRRRETPAHTVMPRVVPAGPSFGGPQSTVPYYGPAPQPPPRATSQPVDDGPAWMIVLVVSPWPAWCWPTWWRHHPGRLPERHYQYRRRPEPAAVPAPTTYGEAEKWLTDNALYAQFGTRTVALQHAPIDRSRRPTRAVRHFNGR